jgi:RNA polymerase sigma factor (sigma-70 family)
VGQVVCIKNLLTNTSERGIVSNNRKRVRKKMWVFATTEKSIALREIRENDISRYVAICKVLAEPDIEMTDAVPLEYAYDLADEGMSPEEETMLSELKKTTTRVLSSLKAREERVLRMRFGMGVKSHTLEEVGNVFNMTGEPIRQIEAKGLRKLKHPSRSRNLRSFLDY